MKRPIHGVRPAEFRDAEAIFALIRTYPEQLILRPLSDITQNIDRCFVCEEKGRVVGTVSWGILPEIGAPRSPSVEIRSLAVQAANQGRGIGRALVAKAVEHIRPLRPAQILAVTFSPDFFRRMGFREVPKEALVHKIYMGCVNCIRYDSPFTCPEVAMALDPASPLRPTRRRVRRHAMGPRSP
jgi:amino-acid N-acetyltransferase